MQTNVKNMQEHMMFSWLDDTIDPGFTVDPNTIDPDFSVDDNMGEEGKEDNDAQIPSPETDTTPNEPSCQRILNIECGVRKSLDIGIVYEDGTRKDVVITKGDKIEVTFINEAKLQVEKGVIISLLKGPKVLNRITNKLQHMYSIKLDCSTRYTSKQVIVYCELIRDLTIIENHEIEIDKGYLENNYFDKNQVDYLISWQDIDGTEIE